MGKLVRIYCSVCGWWTSWDRRRNDVEPCICPDCCSELSQEENKREGERK